MTVRLAQGSHRVTIARERNDEGDGGDGGDGGHKGKLTCPLTRMMPRLPLAGVTSTATRPEGHLMQTIRTCRRSHDWAHTDTHTYRHTQTHARTHTETHRHATQTYARAYTHAQIHTHICTRRHAHRLATATLGTFFRP